LYFILKRGQLHDTHAGFTLCGRRIGDHVGAALCHDGVQDDVDRVSEEAIVEAFRVNGFRLEANARGRTMGDSVLLFFVLFFI